jgi:hypothetical protein
MIGRVSSPCLKAGLTERPFAGHLKAKFYHSFARDKIGPQSNGTLVGGRGMTINLFWPDLSALAG